MNNYYFITTHPYRSDFILNPREDENRIMEEHFSYLQDLLNEGKLYLAGPTLKENDPFGIYILNTETEEEAKLLIESDPSVKAGIQRITILRPLRISLHKCSKSKE